MPTTQLFWPNSARLAVSFSLMFEGGGQPISAAPGFFEEPMEKGLPDLATKRRIPIRRVRGHPQNSRPDGQTPGEALLLP